VILAFDNSQLLESVFNAWNIKNLPAVSWTEHKMIIYQ